MLPCFVYSLCFFRFILFISGVVNSLSRQFILKDYSGTCYSILFPTSLVNVSTIELESAHCRTLSQLSFRIQVARLCLAVVVKGLEVLVMEVLRGCLAASLIGKAWTML